MDMNPVADVAEDTRNAIWEGMRSARRERGFSYRELAAMVPDADESHVEFAIADMVHFGDLQPSRRPFGTRYDAPHMRY